MGAEVLKSALVILLNFCAKFELGCVEIPHFGKPKTVKGHVWAKIYGEKISRKNGGC